MKSLSPGTFTMIFEQMNGGTFIGYIEEVPQLIRVEGNTLNETRQSLFIQLAQLISEANHPEKISIITKVRLRLNHENKE